MRERDEDAPGDASGSLAGGLGETASRRDGGLDPRDIDPRVEAPGAPSGEVGGEVGGDTYGDGAVDDTPWPSDADTSVADPFDTGADDAADGSFDDTPTPDGGPAGSGPLLDLGDAAQSHTIMDGIEFLVDELHDALLGADEDQSAGPDDGAAGL